MINMGLPTAVWSILYIIYWLIRYFRLLFHLPFETFHRLN